MHHKKFQIYTLEMDAIFWHCKTKFRLLLNKGVLKRWDLYIFGELRRVNANWNEFQQRTHLGFETPLVNTFVGIMDLKSSFKFKLKKTFCHSWYHMQECRWYTQLSPYSFAFFTFCCVSFVINTRRIYRYHSGLFCRWKYEYRSIGEETLIITRWLILHMHWLM